MTADRAWPMQITSLGGAVGATVVWRTRGQLSLTVIVKATFALVPYEAMVLHAPEAIHRGELHHRDNPTRSVRVTSDLAPYLGRADVVFTGHAYAPENRRVPRQVVRLAIYRDRPLIEKTLHVYGDREGTNPPKPFQRMAVAYERAYGGVGWKANPLGIGFTGHNKEPTGLPNVVNPTDPTLTDGFGPISRNWPVRKKLLGKMDRKLLERPIAEIPDDFDWTYFQAAPADQQTDFLQGDEWIVLDGLHAELPRLQSILPGARGAARLYGPEGSLPIELHADTLRIDGDEQRCSLVWRGITPIRDEASIAALRVLVGVELPGESIQWPESLPLQGEDFPTEELGDRDLIDSVTTLKRADSTHSDVVRHSMTATAALPPARPGARRAAVPFPSSGSPPRHSPPPPIPGAPWSAAPAPGPVDLGTTHALDPDSIPSSEVPFLRTPARGSARSEPIPGAPWSGVPAPASRPVTAKTTRTFDLAFDKTPMPGSTRRFEDSITDVAPTQKSHKRARPVTPAPAAAMDDLPPPRARFPSDESLTGLVPVDPTRKRPPAPPPSAPEAPPPPAKPAPAPEKPAWPWASPPPTEATEEPPARPAPRPPKPQKAAVKKSLYGGFTPKK